MPLRPKRAAITVKPPTIKMKTCIKCKKTLPLTKDYYPLDKSKSNGFKSLCKECHRQISKAYYFRVTRQKNSAKSRKTDMEWGALNIN